MKQWTSLYFGTSLSNGPTELEFIMRMKVWSTVGMKLTVQNWSMWVKTATLSATNTTQTGFAWNWSSEVTGPHLTAWAMHGTAYRTTLNILNLLTASLITASVTPQDNNEAKETNSIDGGKDGARSFPLTACCLFPPQSLGTCTCPCSSSLPKFTATNIPVTTMAS